MPPTKQGGKLPDAVIADFEEWVRMGAPDPRDSGAKVVRPETDFKKAGAFWSFLTPRSVLAPQGADAKWPRTDIDRFILAAQEAKGLRLVADVEPTALLRRLYFDLIGLPPSPADVQALVKECGSARAPGDSTFRIPISALEKVVDRLLASP